jgi:seryl-tRNA synthetase
MPATDGSTVIAPGNFRDELIAHGLLIETGVPGVYGRSAEFEDTVERIDRRVIAIGEADRPEIMRFPPVLNRAHFEASGYLKSFPHLIGTIHHFAGADPEHRELLRVFEQSGDWSASFRPAPLVLTPAACYPVYPVLAGALPPGGRLVDVMSYCYRHEPSDDAGRMQMFRMHEHVRAAGADEVVGWRNKWIERVRDFAAVLEVPATCDVASDPFFGRAGKLLAGTQREQGLKLEFVAPVSSDRHPTAIVSLNYHQDYFGRLFAIRMADGTTAHTSCVGFGLERIALALYRSHGFVREHWKQPVRDALGL